MLEFDENKFLADLEYLVNIDSGTGTPEGVARVADFLEEKYKAMGLKVERHVFDERYGPCLEARSHPDEEGIDILLIGHMDTVFPPGTATERPFRMEDGIAYGPGVADMKSGDLLAAAFAKNMLRERPDLKLCIANNCDEEIGSVSADPWIRRLARESRYCIDFEPGRPDGSFVKARKGVQKLILKATGVSAHAGANPDGGANAILELAKWICHFDEYWRAEGGARPNFDVISGGTVYNTIPAEAECEVDIRYDAAADLEKLMAEFEMLRQNTFDPRVKVELTLDGNTPPMTINEESLAVMALMEEEGAKLGMDVRFISTGGGSDASRVSCEGTAAIDCCGPVGIDIHNEKERMIISTAEERLRLMIEVCKRL